MAKRLQVLGEFSPSSEGCSVFTVTMSINEDGHTCVSDKTYDEVVTANEAGKIVRCVFAGYVLPLCCVFSGQVVYGGTAGFASVMIIQTPDSCVFYETTIPSTGITYVPVTFESDGSPTTGISGSDIVNMIEDRTSEPILIGTADSEVFVYRLRHGGASILGSRSYEFVYTDGLTVDTIIIYKNGSMGRGRGQLDAYTFGAIPAPTTAKVGQTVVAKAVDENGVPTEWESVDFPSGGSSVTGLDWEYINTLSFVKDDGVASLYCSETADGNPFEYDEILIMNPSSDYGGSANIWCNRETMYFTDCVQIKSFLAFGNKKYCLLKSLLVEDNIQWILAEGTLNNPVLYNISKGSGAMRTDGKITSVCVAKPNTSDNAQATLQFYGRNYK